MFFEKKFQKKIIFEINKMENKENKVDGCIEMNIGNEEILTEEEYIKMAQKSLADWRVRRKRRRLRAENIKVKGLSIASKGH